MKKGKHFFNFMKNKVIVIKLQHFFPPNIRQDVSAKKLNISLQTPKLTQYIREDMMKQFPFFYFIQHASSNKKVSDTCTQQINPTHMFIFLFFCLSKRISPNYMKSIYIYIYANIHYYFCLIKEAWQILVLCQNNFFLYIYLSVCHFAYLKTG